MPPTKTRREGARDRSLVFPLLLVLVALIAAERTHFGFDDLLFGESRNAGKDLRLAFLDVELWFSGQEAYRTPVWDLRYGGMHLVVYPPASLLLLWPAVGLTSFDGARLLWGVIAALSLALLSVSLALLVKPAGRMWQLAAAIFPMAMYATSQSIHLGQLTLPSIALIAASVALLRSRGRFWTAPLLAVTFTLALVKPSLAAPFFWLMLLTPRGRLSAAATVLLYAALSAVATLWQEGSLFALVMNWLDNARVGILGGAQTGGYGSLPNLLEWCGFLRGQIVESMLAVAGLGGLIYRFRRGGLLPLLALTALYSRLMFYHSSYDDLLVVLALPALLAFASDGTVSIARQRAAAIMLALCTQASLAPLGWLYIGTPWTELFMSLQVSVWLTATLYLLIELRWRCAASPAPAPGAPAATTR